MSKFIIAALKFLSAIAIMLLNGVTLATLWGWFVVVTFGAPVLAIPVAIGLYMIAAFLTKQPDFNATDRENIYAEMTAVQYLVPLGMLATGWVVKQFM